MNNIPTPSALLALLSELEKLEKKATGGKWLPVVPDNESEQFKDNVARFPYDRHQEEQLHVMLKAEHCEMHAIVDCSCNHTCIELLEQEDNAKLIAALRNAAPSLISALRLAVEGLEKLRSKPTAYIQDQQKVITEALAQISALFPPQE